MAKHLLFGRAIVVLALAFGLLQAASTAGAAPVFSDDFDDGTTGNWYRGGTNGTLSNAGTTLNWAEAGSGGDEVIGRSFTTQALGIGETLQFKFDYTMTGGVSIVRAGLFDTATTVAADGFQPANDGYDGYYTFLRDNSSSANNARFEDESSDYILAGGTTIGSATTQFDMQLNTQYLVVFDVTRTSASQIDTLIEFNSSDGSTTHMSVTGTDTTNLQTSFDGAFIRTTGGPVVLDNISVTLIPEPATIALVAGGLLGLRRRRRK